MYHIFVTRVKGKFKDEWGSGQNSDCTFPRVEFSTSKFGFVIADCLLSHSNFI